MKDPKNDLKRLGNVPGLLSFTTRERELLALAADRLEWSEAHLIRMAALSFAHGVAAGLGVDDLPHLVGLDRPEHTEGAIETMRAAQEDE